MNWFKSLFLPAAASEHARSVDDLFMFIVFLSIFFFVLISGLIFVFVAKYKRRTANDFTPHIAHNTQLEIIWSVIPLALVTVLFFWGFKTYMQASVAPNESIEIQVTAKKWLWSFEYANGMRMGNEIRVPVNKPVKLVMMSDDVIHSFYAPAFRVKQDVLPNRYTETWFQPTQVGDYDVQCTEYCGKGHSQMNAKIKVVSQAEFDRFLVEGPEEWKTMPLPELGKIMYVSQGCQTCHSVDGSRGQGPSWKGIYGQVHQFTDGSSAPVDENYIRTSILNPQVKIVRGYEGIMPTYQGLLTDRQLLALIEYIKTLK
jgi:cytochrome c oxidase subunit 2